MATHTPSGRKKVSAKPMLDRAFKAGKPSDYGIRGISDILPTDRAISLARESSEAQADGLVDQQLMIQKMVAVYGGEYLNLGDENVQAVRSSHPKDRYGEPTTDYHLLRQAVYLAKKHDASVIVAESMSRIVRNVHWQTKPRGWNEAKRGKWKFNKLQATDEQLVEVAEILGDFELVLLVHPDATADEERAFERKRRREGKRGCKKPGPKRKKKEKRPNGGWTKKNPELLTAVLELLAEGVGTLEIARQKKMKPQTVSDIKKRHLP